MQGLDVDDATVDGDLAVATLRVAERLQGPEGIVQGGIATAMLELAARAAAEAFAGLGPGHPAVPHASTVEARLHAPTPVETELVALVLRGEDDTWEVRVTPADDADEADFGNDEVGTDVLVSGVVELAGLVPQPTLDDLVEIALDDPLPEPVPIEAAPVCFVCGVHSHDGLHLFPAWPDGSSQRQHWAPDERVADDAGRFVDPAAMAAVLDCPTVWTCRDHMAAHGFGGALLGGYTVSWFSRAPLDETLRIGARFDDADGRKMHSSAVLVGEDGHVKAAVRAFQVGVASFPGVEMDPLPAWDTVDW